MTIILLNARGSVGAAQSTNGAPRRAPTGNARQRPARHHRRGGHCYGCCAACGLLVGRCDAAQVGPARLDGARASVTRCRFASVSVTLKERRIQSCGVLVAAPRAQTPLGDALAFLGGKALRGWTERLAFRALFCGPFERVGSPWRQIGAHAASDRAMTARATRLLLAAARAFGLVSISLGRAWYL